MAITASGKAPLTEQEIQDIEQLMREMDLESDGWYGRASWAIRTLYERLPRQSQEV